MSSHGALLVFGSGPGVGRGVAAIFASRNFKKVFVLSRSAERLEEDASYVRENASEGVSVEAVTIDLSDLQSVQYALKEVESRLGDTPVETILFNGSRTGASPMLDFTVEKFESDIRIAIVSLYTIAQWALPKMVKTSAEIESANPALIVTSGMIWKQPNPKVFSLGVCKGGQHNLVDSLHQEFEPKGVHVGLIIIGGTVAKESKVTNPRNIAEEAWKIYSQPKGEKGPLEFVMMDPAFEEHVKSRNSQK